MRRLNLRDFRATNSLAPINDARFRGCVCASPPEFRPYDASASFLVPKVEAGLSSLILPELGASLNWAYSPVAQIDASLDGTHVPSRMVASLNAVVALDMPYSHRIRASK